jgi:hypothetical protein
MVSPPSEELWNRIRAATRNRDQAEQSVMRAGQPTSYAGLKMLSQQAVSAGGRAFANALLKEDDDYVDPQGRAISYEEFARLHGLLRRR